MTKLISFQDIVGKDLTQQQLREIEQRVNEHHERLDNSSIKDINHLMHLLLQLIVATKEESPEFVPRFELDTPFAEILTVAVVGCYRNLRIAYKLLMDGYAAEMQNVARMAGEWSECILVLEGCPDDAERILANGVRRKDIRNAASFSAEINDWLGVTKKRFSELSERAHVARAAINLISTNVEDGERLVFLNGISSEEEFHRNTLVLATMVNNILSVSMRHFKDFPDEWLDEYKERNCTLKKRVEELSRRT